MEVMVSRVIIGFKLWPLVNPVIGDLCFGEVKMCLVGCVSLVYHVKLFSEQDLKILGKFVGILCSVNHPVFDFFREGEGCCIKGE